MLAFLLTYFLCCVKRKEEKTRDVLPEVLSKEILGNCYVKLLDISPRVVPKDRTSEVAIIQSARISHGCDVKTPEEDNRLLRYLWKHKHMSPFESVQLTFEMKVPIFVARHVMRHRTAKVNEISGRYVELKNERYQLPLRYKGGDNKQGSVEEGTPEQKERIECLLLCANSFLDELSCLYEDLLQEGYAPELARCILPLSTLTQYRFSIDLRNFINFWSLRSDPTAQWETQEVARAMWELARPLFPVLADVIEKEKLGIFLDGEEVEALREKIPLKGSSVSRKKEFQKKKERLGLVC